MTSLLQVVGYLEVVESTDATVGEEFAATRARRREVRQWSEAERRALSEHDRHARARRSARLPTR